MRYNEWILWEKSFVIVLMMRTFLEDLEKEFTRKVVSLPWIWTLTNGSIAHAELIDIHEGKLEINFLK